MPRTGSRTALRRTTHAIGARFVVAIATIVVLSALSAGAVAQPPARSSAPAGDATTLARQRYELGKRLVAEQRFAEALAEFSAGYALANRPLFLFNMGECARALRDHDRARALYERYLATAPAGEHAAIARARLTELGRSPATPIASPVASPPLRISAMPVAMASPTTAPPSIVMKPIGSHSRSRWRRPALWIGVGLAVAAGSALIYASRSGDACAPPTCLDVRNP